MSKLAGKVAIITGSSTGIGRATALLFAQEGASVTVHGRSTESLNKTVELLKTNGIPESRFQVVQGQIEVEQTCKDLIEKTIQKFGKLDILVNNHGIAELHGAADLAIENFDYVFNANLRSVILMTNLAIPYLEKTQGNVISVSSAGSLRPSAFHPFYRMAKLALDHFGRCYSLLLAPKGIRVNTLNPGFIHTEFGTKIGMTHESYAEFLHKTGAEQVPLGRPGTPEEMAKTILFIVADATYMTGSNIIHDGGWLQWCPLPKGLDAYTTK